MSVTVAMHSFAMAFAQGALVVTMLAGLAESQHDWENSGKLHKYPVFAIVDTLDDGVSREIGNTKKFENNPLWTQDREWEPRIDNGYPNVIHDPHDPLGAWRMWYGASLWEYATSADGIHWTKPDLDMYDLGAIKKEWGKYGKHNNVIMFGNGMGIYKDYHDKNPDRRFKAFGGPSCFYGKGGGARDCSGNVQGTAVSPDGLYWYDARNVSWPYKAGDPSGPHQKYDTHQNLFWDASKNKYIATTRDLKPFPWRSIAIAESYENELAFNITHPPPSVVQGTANYQPYSQITFPYYGIYLGLASVYDAAHGETEGRVHLRLTYSLDAQQWDWIDSGGLTGKDFIPLGKMHGEENQFDSHIIFAAAYPIRMPDSTVRVYYMGGNGPHSGPRNSSFGLATIRPDGFVSLSGTGDVRLMQIRCTAPTLVVTADVLAVGGSVRVGVDGAVGGMKHLSPSDASPITESTTDHPIVFASGKATFAKAGLLGKDVTLRIVLDRSAVFTIGFTW